MIKEIIYSLLTIALSLIVGTIVGKILYNTLGKPKENYSDKIEHKTIIENVKYVNI